MFDVMKIVYILFLSLWFCGEACAQNECLGVRANQIAELKQNFQECLLVYPDGADTDAVMVNVTRDKIKCMQHVAYLVFDAFYKSSKGERQKQFDDFVQAVIEQGYNLEQRSDIGKHWHTGKMYELGAYTHAYIAVHDMVEEYIRSMETECVDFSNDALEELKGV